MYKHYRFFFGLLLFWVAASTLACTSKKTPVADATVVEVNGMTLTVRELSRELARRLYVFDALAVKDSKNISHTKEMIIRDFVMNSLLNQYAKESQLDISEAELDEEVQRVRSTHPDDITFKDALLKEGITFNDWRLKTKVRLLQQKAMRKMVEAKNAVNDQELLATAKKIYTDNPDKYAHPEYIKIQHIVVAKEDEAEKLLKKLREGASFPDLAKKFSVAPEGKSGGILDKIQKGVSPAFDAAFKQGVGSLSKTIQSPYGYHLIKVLEKHPAGRYSFETVRDSILRELRSKNEQTVFAVWLKEALAKAKVLRNDELINKLQPVTGDKDQ